MLAVVEANCNSFLLLLLIFKIKFQLASQRNRLPAFCLCYETKASLSHQKALCYEVRLEFIDSEIYESPLTCL